MEQGHLKYEGIEVSNSDNDIRWILIRDKVYNKHRMEGGYFYCYVYTMGGETRKKVEYNLYETEEKMAELFKSGEWKKVRTACKHCYEWASLF